MVSRLVDDMNGRSSSLFSTKEDQKEKHGMSQENRAVDQGKTTQLDKKELAFLSKVSMPVAALLVITSVALASLVGLASLFTISFDIGEPVVWVAVYLLTVVFGQSNAARKNKRIIYWAVTVLLACVAYSTCAGVNQVMSAIIVWASIPGIEAGTVAFVIPLVLVQCLFSTLCSTIWYVFFMWWSGSFSPSNTLSGKPLKKLTLYVIIFTGFSFALALLGTVVPSANVVVDTLFVNIVTMLSPLMCCASILLLSKQFILDATTEYPYGRRSVFNDGGLSRRGIYSLWS